MGYIIIGLIVISLIYTIVQTILEKSNQTGILVAKILRILFAIPFLILLIAGIPGFVNGASLFGGNRMYGIEGYAFTVCILAIAFGPLTMICFAGLLITSIYIRCNLK